MPRKPTPYFPIYASELLTDERIAELTDAELGVLVKLWAKMWINGIERGTLLFSKTKPISDEQIAKFLQKNLEETQKILHRLVVEVGILKRGKFGELFSKRLRNFKTEWELRQSKLKNSSRRNVRHSSPIPHGGMSNIPHHFHPPSSAAASAAASTVPSVSLSSSFSLKEKDESKETPAAIKKIINFPQNQNRKQTKHNQKLKNSFEETKNLWQKVFGKKITNQQIGKLLKSGFAISQKDRNCLVILQFIREHKHTKFVNPYAYAISLTCPEKRPSLEALKKRALCRESKELGLSSIGEIFKKYGVG